MDQREGSKGQMEMMSIMTLLFLQAKELVRQQAIKDIALKLLLLQVSCGGLWRYIALAEPSWHAAS